MYTEHFGLNEKPFSISPDPRYLYLSQRHADALAHLLYGVAESGGFIQLTGEVGTGKTTLIRSLLEQLPDNTEVALILNPQVSKRQYLTAIIQFLQAICQELRIPVPPRGSAKALIDVLNERLLALHAENKRVVLIIDEAQTMSPELLEQVRLLTNLETSRQKLLQIILIGQPELRELLADVNMRQIAQRITGRYHLEPLSAADTSAYVAHRLRVAGGRTDIFTPRAIRKLFRISRGIPRLINVVADRALLAAYTRDEHRIGAALVRHAAKEVFGQPRARRWWPWAAAGLLAAATLTWFVVDRSENDGAASDDLQLALADIAPADAAAAAGLIDRSAAAPDLEALLANGEPYPATTALLQLWGIEASGDDVDACALAAESGLRCLTLAGQPLDRIRQFDRPARLEVRGIGDEPRYLLFTGLADDKASVRIGSDTHKVRLSDLEGLEFGEQLILWRPATGQLDEPLVEGMRGPAIVWLRTSLEELSGDTLASDEPDLFGPELTAAVIRFQQDAGLTADGAAGDMTLAILQSGIGLVGTRLTGAEY